MEIFLKDLSKFVFQALKVKSTLGEVTSQGIDTINPFVVATNSKSFLCFYPPKKTIQWLIFRIRK